MSGPVPSNLVSLGDLPSCKPGSKVRFLGCVDQYDVQTATLRLKHHHFTSNETIMAHVNIEPVLERIKRHETEVGTWVNVIGNIEKSRRKDIFVQAVALWDAGNIDLNAYEEAIEKRKQADFHGPRHTTE